MQWIDGADKAGSNGVGNRNSNRNTGVMPDPEKGRQEAPPDPEEGTQEALLDPEEEAREAPLDLGQETWKVPSDRVKEIREAPSYSKQETKYVAGLAAGSTCLEGRFVPARRKVTISGNFPPNNVIAHAELTGARRRGRSSDATFSADN